MKTKIVYCLVSDISDYYYEQLLISLCSLRKHNPDAQIEIVCDYDTFASLKDNRRSIYDYGACVTPVDTPKNWAKWERSRFLKTNLRLLINGDYLYLDVDTIVCSSLSFVDSFSFDIGAVREGHLERPLPKKTQCRHESEFWIWEKVSRLNIDITGLLHFNSGVMYVKDSEKTRELYTNWSEKYFAQLKFGVKSDQLPLLILNNEMGDVITPLANGLNCQVVFKEGRKLVYEAKIIHYFPQQHKTILSSPWLLKPIKDAGKINMTIQDIIDNPVSFFYNISKFAMGNEASLLDTPYITEAYSSCPKFFRIWLYLLNAYLTLKKSLYRLLH